MSNPKVIGIRFHDNDFYYTVTAFLEILKNQGLDKYTDYGRKEITKELIVELFNRSAAGIYWVVQNRMEYSTEWNASEYLKIEERHVYFDDEVIEHQNKVNGNDNGEFFVLDTEVYENYVYSV